MVLMNLNDRNVYGWYSSMSLSRLQATDRSPTSSWTVSWFRYSEMVLLKLKHLLGGNILCLPEFVGLLKLLFRGLVLYQSTKVLPDCTKDSCHTREPQLPCWMEPKERGVKNKSSCCGVNGRTMILPKVWSFSLVVEPISLPMRPA